MQGAAALAGAATKVVDARIVEVRPRGFLLAVGTEQMEVEDGFSTRYWKGKASVKRDAFVAGDLVTARVRPDARPAELREIAERDTWKWLDGIRKEPRAGSVLKVDSDSVTVRLQDGTSFRYRATPKTQLQFRDQPKMSLADLREGMAVFAKGRTLANLETWLVLLSDAPIPTEPTRASKRDAPPPPLPEAGVIEAQVLIHFPSLRLFDVLEGVRTLHISYNLGTKFFLNGAACKPSELEKGQQALIEYRRDRTGKIMATKVRLVTRTLALGPRAGGDRGPSQRIMSPGNLIGFREL